MIPLIPLINRTSLLTYAALAIVGIIAIVAIARIDIMTYNPSSLGLAVGQDGKDGNTDTKNTNEKASDRERYDFCYARYYDNTALCWKNYEETERDCPWLFGGDCREHAKKALKACFCMVDRSFNTCVGRHVVDLNHC